MEMSTCDVRWSTDRIEPTYMMGDLFGWRIDSRICIEVRSQVPVVAWAEFSDCRQGVDQRLLATLQLDEYGFHERFDVWQLSAPSVDGVREARRMSEDHVCRHLAEGGALGIMSGRIVSPVLAAIFDQALEKRSHVEAEERRRREADPLLVIVEELFELGICTAVAARHPEIREVRSALESKIAGLNRSDVNEVLARMAMEYAAHVAGGGSLTG